MSNQFNLPWRKLLLLGSAVVIIVLIVGAGIVLTAPTPMKFIKYQKAAPFTLIDQNNNTMTLNNYLGKVLVMDFIYTHCPNPNGTLGECSTETANMNNMLTDLLQMGYTTNDFHFISISFDWKFDNVSVMKAYGENRAEGQFQYWSFLSGSQAQVKNATTGYHIDAEYFNTTNNLNQTVPLVTAQPSVNNTVEYMGHSLMVYLIDKTGYIRILEGNKGELFPVSGSTWSPKEVVKQVVALIKE